MMETFQSSAGSRPNGPSDQHIQVNINQQLIIEEWLAWRFLEK
jgi:hypothetical protein